MIAVPLRYQDSDNRFMLYLGQMFANFTRKHNLTFETALFNGDLDLEVSCRQWTVEFGFGLVTEAFPMWQSLLATNLQELEFAETKTLMGFKLRLPSPWRLSTWSLPWNVSVACLLISTAGLLGLLLFHRRPEVMKGARSLWALRILGSLFLLATTSPRDSKHCYVRIHMPTEFAILLHMFRH